jgi:hypothetical protein
MASGNPGRQPQPPPPDYTFVCGNGVGTVVAHAVESEYFKTFTRKDGSMLIIVTGHAQSTFTRLSDGKTLTINSSGPAFITVAPDGSVTIKGTGQSTYLLPNGAWQYTGAVQFDGMGNVLSHAGNVTDICQLLAGL